MQSFNVEPNTYSNLVHNASNAYPWPNSQIYPRNVSLFLPNSLEAQQNGVSNPQTMQQAPVFSLPTYNGAYSYPGIMPLDAYKPALTANTSWMNEIAKQPQDNLVGNSNSAHAQGSQSTNFMMNNLFGQQPLTTEAAAALYYPYFGLMPGAAAAGVMPDAGAAAQVQPPPPMPGVAAVPQQGAIPSSNGLLPYSMHPTDIWRAMAQLPQHMGYVLGGGGPVPSPDATAAAAAALMARVAQNQPATPQSQASLPSAVTTSPGATPSAPGSMYPLALPQLGYSPTGSYGPLPTSASGVTAIPGLAALMAPSQYPNGVMASLPANVPPMPQAIPPQHNPNPAAAAASAAALPMMFMMGQGQPPAPTPVLAPQGPPPLAPAPNLPMMLMMGQPPAGHAASPATAAAAAVVASALAQSVPGSVPSGTAGPQTSPFLSSSVIPGSLPGYFPPGSNPAMLPAFTSMPGYSSTTTPAIYTSAPAQPPATYPATAQLPQVPVLNSGIAPQLPTASSAAVSNLNSSDAAQTSIPPLIRARQGESVEARKQRRKESNRESARRSRMRKEGENVETARRVEMLGAANAALRGQLTGLQGAVEVLTQHNATLQECVLRLMSDPNMSAETLEYLSALPPPSASTPQLLALLQQGLPVPIIPAPEAAHAHGRRLGAKDDDSDSGCTELGSSECSRSAAEGGTSSSLEKDKGCSPSDSGTSRQRSEVGGMGPTAGVPAGSGSVGPNPSGLTVGSGVGGTGAVAGVLVGHLPAGINPIGPTMSGLGMGGTGLVVGIQGGPGHMGVNPSIYTATGSSVTGNELTSGLQSVPGPRGINRNGPTAGIEVAAGVQCEASPMGSNHSGQTGVGLGVNGPWTSAGAQGASQSVGVHASGPTAIRSGKGGSDTATVSPSGLESIRVLPSNPIVTEGSTGVRGQVSVMVEQERVAGDRYEQTGQLREGMPESLSGQNGYGAKEGEKEKTKPQAVTRERAQEVVFSNAPEAAHAQVSVNTPVHDDRFRRGSGEEHSRLDACSAVETQLEVNQGDVGVSIRDEARANGALDQERGRPDGGPCMGGLGEGGLPSTVVSRKRSFGEVDNGSVAP